jgi:hypothetical protein
MRSIRIAARSSAIVMASLLVLVLGGTPAHAVSPYVYSFVGPDYGLINAVSDTDAWACMKNTNFHTVWTQVEMTRSPYTRYVYDVVPDNTCGYSNYAGTGYISRFRFCVETVGCSAWKPSVPGS